MSIWRHSSRVPALADGQAGAARCRVYGGNRERPPRQGDVHNAVHHVGSVLFLETAIVAFFGEVYEVAPVGRTSLVRHVRAPRGRIRKSVLLRPSPPPILRVFTKGAMIGILGGTYREHRWIRAGRTRRKPRRPSTGRWALWGPWPGESPATLCSSGSPNRASTRSCCRGPRRAWAAPLCPKAGPRAGRRLTVLAVPLGLFSEWKFAPFMADDGLDKVSAFSSTHLYGLKPVTIIMIVLGGAIAYWIGKGTQKRSDVGWDQRSAVPPTA